MSLDTDEGRHKYWMTTNRADELINIILTNEVDRMCSRTLRLMCLGFAKVFENHAWSGDWCKVVETIECYVDGKDTPFGPRNVNVLKKATDSIESVHGWLWCALRNDGSVETHIEATLHMTKGMSGRWDNDRAADVVRDIFPSPFKLYPHYREYPKDVLTLNNELFNGNEEVIGPLSDLLEEHELFDQEVIEDLRGYKYCPSCRGTKVQSKRPDLPCHYCKNSAIPGKVYNSTELNRIHCKGYWLVDHIRGRLTDC